MTITEIRGASPADFDEFVRTEGESLLRLAYLLTTEPAPAVAALEDALAKTYKCWPRLAATGHPEDFVRRALVHEATESHRLRRSAPQPARDDDDELVVALRALPADERAATVLRHCLDLSEMETAATLGCTVGSVRRQTMRALSRLRVLVPQPAGRTQGHGLVEIVRHLQAALRALPERVDLRPAPDLLRNIRLTHARRTMRRRTALLAVAASALVLLAVMVLQTSAGTL